MGHLLLDVPAPPMPGVQVPGVPGGKPPTREAVTIVRTSEALSRLRPAWQRLQTQPWCDVDFNLCLIAARPGKAQLFALALGDLQAPRALLVARLQDTTLDVRFGYLTLLRPAVRAIEVISGGALGDLDETAARLLVQALQQQLRAKVATVVRFEHLPLDAPLAIAARTAGAVLARPEPEPHWTTAIPDSYAAFLKGLGKSTQRNLKRYPQQFLAAWPQHEVKVYSAPEQLDTILTELESVAANSYHRGLGAGFQATPENRAMLQLSLQKGWYRAWVLHLEGRPVAFWDGHLYRGTFHTHATAYLPALEAARPGWFLLTRLLIDLCEDPIVHAIDFGIGDAQYKRMLCSRSVAEAPLVLYAETLRGRWLECLIGGTDATARWAKRLLDRTGLLARLKKRWRQKLAVAAAPEGGAGEASGSEPAGAQKD